ncbi:MAG: hypothetical protein IRY85_16720 [Micromonosporaceae bacterium]|nr:hypothetical protein [Micromonosporaceae bacterium]
MADEPIEAYRRAAQVVASGGMDASEVLAALASLPAVRRDLDRVERELIGVARDLGVAWPVIAQALGLGTRQAAEQRWLRLAGGPSRDPARVRAARREQRIVDTASGERLVELRRAARELHRRIESDRSWDGRHSRAALARATVAAALDAPPSGLFSLCHNALEDLDQMPAGPLPPALAAAIRRFRSAVRQARPQG